MPQPPASVTSQSHPFSHRLVTADLVNVQDISVEKIGFVPTVLGFGDLVCQTASGAGSGAPGTATMVL